MPKPTTKQLTQKQMQILKLLAKLRMGNIYHITYYLKPELRDQRRDNPKFDSARKNTSKTIKLLIEARYVKPLKLSQSSEVFYHLTSEGLRIVYNELNITAAFKGVRSGYDFDLGYFEWRTPPYENIHFQFQTDVMASIMSLNKGVELSLAADEQLWEFGGVRLSNICSVRDNLHSSPRNTKLKENDLYKPDMEVAFKQSRYNEQGDLILLPNGDSKRIAIEQEFYFVECDRKTEYGERLEAKFARLNKRLKELEQRNELQYFKGIIWVLDDNQNKSDEQVCSRHLRFYSAFMEQCGAYAAHFTTVTTRYSEIGETLLSLRREYQQDFGKALIKSWRHESLQTTFLYEDDLTDKSKSFVNVKPQIGNVRVRFNATRSHLAIFFNIEGLNTIEWQRAIELYNAYRTQARKHNEDVMEGKRQGKTYEVVPIISYRHQRPYAPQMIMKQPIVREQESFFMNLYVMDMRTNRPVFYKGDELKKYDDIEFIIKE